MWVLDNFSMFFHLGGKAVLCKSRCNDVTYPCDDWQIIVYFCRPGKTDVDASALTNDLTVATVVHLCLQ
jgi:hypothetical protein